MQGDASALCGGLADEGLRINPNQQRASLTWPAANVTGRVTIVRRTGWHDIDGHRVFVLPDETIGPKGSERVILIALLKEANARVYAKPLPWRVKR